jgi:C-terminal processing protease CtpA/Prc
VLARKIDTLRTVQTVTLSKFFGHSVGLSVSSATTARDTLGVLVTSVVAGSVAERAGVVEGNRIAAINGVNLKLSAADAGQPDMQGIMARRFQREIARVGAGDSARLNIFAESGYRDVTLRMDPPAPKRVSLLRSGEDANRATLGALVGGAASRRDTLGVFITEIAENGPLARSGVYEGSRIAAIGSVDLRVAAASAGEARASQEKMDLLIAELGKHTAGDSIVLRVYDNGQFRTVRVATMRRGDVELPGAANMRIFRGGQDGNIMLLPKLDIIGEHLRIIAPQLDSISHMLDRRIVIPLRVERLGSVALDQGRRRLQRSALSPRSVLQRAAVALAVESAPPS